MAVEAPQAWPALAGWLRPDLPELNRVIVLRCFHDLGICEVPPGSNRSGRIDTYTRRAGSPPGSYWCATWATAVWVDAGADVPPSARGSNDMIRDWAEARGQWKPAPIEGALVLYGSRTEGGFKRLANGKADAVHIGIIVRRDPYLISAEGNTSFAGFSTNGEAVLLKRVDTSRVLGYVHPTQRRLT